MDFEKWKPISETNGIYEVSNYGRVRNCITGTIRKPYRMPNDYLCVHYNLNKKTVRRYIHRLVAEAFCTRKDGCNTVNHLDNDRGNNCADNLEWTTQFWNVHHGMKQKRYRLNARPVIGYKDGIKYEFHSAHEAKLKTGCDDKQIGLCCKKIIKQTKGFIWEYAEVG